ncbi:hypothetical protein [Aliivibrio sifiae]|uniref:hypothetical protein n=1 Tax=Aliivibrio sifiae TaxID=566293 RepID=UPI0021579E81|nr:hypothetical protein [Aliivibrio sifiae]
MINDDLGSKLHLTNASTRFATFGILGFFEFTVLSGKFRLNLHGSKRVMQALNELSQWIIK